MIEVCGVKYSEGTSKKTGKPYKGFMVYYTKEGASKGVKGYVAESCFLSADLLQGCVIDVGDKLDIRYDRSGFVEEVEVLK